MSLVGVLVLCDDGNLYEDPVFYGDDWFLCFDDDDDPEIVIERKGRSNQACLHCVGEILKETGISADLSSSLARTAIRCFPPYEGYRSRNADAVAYWLDINRPIPAGLKMQHGGMMTKERWERKRPQAVIWTFGEKF
jgi:hypothetical protein